jgi:hypothetical protein
MAVSAHEMPPISDPARPRAILRLNALVALAGGSLMLLLAGPAARILGLGSRTLLAVAGIVLIGFGSDELFVAVRRGLRPLHVHLFAIADLALVAGGAVFLAVGPAALTFLERAIVAVVAIALGLFAIEEFRSARTLS